MFILVLCFCRQLAAEDILFLVCACMCPLSCTCTKHLLAPYLTNRLWEFHQIYNWDAIGDKVIRFWGRKVNRSRSQQTKFGQKSHVQKCTFLAKAYRSIACRWRPFSYCLTWFDRGYHCQAQLTENTLQVKPLTSQQYYLNKNWAKETCFESFLI